MDVTAAVKELKRLAPQWLVPQWFKGAVDRIGPKLLVLAKRKSKRPHYSSDLGKGLSYLLSRRRLGDKIPILDQIEKLVPLWFPEGRRSERVSAKETLLALARRRLGRPRMSTKLGRRLAMVTSKGSACFDAKFSDEIRSLAPWWFGDWRDPQFTQEKDELLAIARRGDPRPGNRTRLGKRLRFSRNDLDFMRRLEKLAPTWFFSGRRALIEKKLLARARKGLGRPTGKLEKKLRYLSASKTRGNVAFVAVLRKLAPGWFVQRPVQRPLSSHGRRLRTELIKLAEKGGTRPRVGTRLGNALKKLLRRRTGNDGTTFRTLLDSINPLWFPKEGRFESRWDMMYSLLLDFWKHSGHCRVPENWKGVEDLCSWTRAQRRRRRLGRLSERRISLLDKIGYVWDISEKNESASA